MVTATATSTTIISVQWDRVDCMQRNSDITGYVVSYAQRGNESDSETVTVMGTTDRTYTLVGLMASTQYVVMVAAMNSDGVTGPFSNPVFVRTLGKTIGIYIVTVDSLCANYCTMKPKVCVSPTCLVLSLSVSIN